MGIFNFLFGVNEVEIGSFMDRKDIDYEYLRMLVNRK